MADLDINALRRDPEILCARASSDLSSIRNPQYDLAALPPPEEGRVDERS